MKYRIFAIIAVAGILSTAIGAWHKILHKPGADLYLTIGIYGEAIGLAALAWFAFDYFRRKEK
jgi:hypothetical protein